MNLSGTVSNGSDGVTIFVSGPEKSCLDYYMALRQSPPANARITFHHLEAVAEYRFEGFSIQPSTLSTKSSLLTPDIALCYDCRRELSNPSDRRWHYPFTTCLQCGPRYSIIEALPYDRENTTMNSFEMCPACANEFVDMTGRRHYAQTNSCPDCPITLTLINDKGQVLSNDTQEIFARVIQSLNKGEIVAIKNTGGFLLLADATSIKALSRLRQRKHRPNKPFAVLYPSLHVLQTDLLVDPQEVQILTGKQCPIVLLRRRPASATGAVFSLIAPGLEKVGAMLPYTPLLEVLMQGWGKPLVATSGNLSGSPIVYTNEEALQSLTAVADYLVVNDRDIVVPQDDSVVQVTPEHHQLIFLRRSRGYAPCYLPAPFPSASETLLAMGADMKSAFALTCQQNMLVSQYLGDLSSYDTQEAFEHTLNHLLNIYEAVPEKIIIDNHPQYFSSELGKRLALKYNADVGVVPHHVAHFSAVLAENALLTTDEPVLGVIWDGTGWGNDHAVWGGEFFRFDGGVFKRIAHLPYFDHFLNDKISKEPRLSALSLCKRIPAAQPLLEMKFNKTEWNLYHPLLQTHGHLQTSSVGRLFDGVASLLGLCDRSTYEGEAALYLETLATSWTGGGQLWEVDWELSVDDLIRQIVRALLNGSPRNEIAWQFHHVLVQWVAHVAQQSGINKIAFSGGVFQNALLTDLLIDKLGKRYALFFHKQLSPNDECIGFGQLAYEELKRRGCTLAPQRMNIVN